MNNDHLCVTDNVIPQGIDNFKLIRGIGPMIAQRLHDAGIITFAQLAELSPEEIVAQIGRQSGTSARRITEEDWIGQARELAKTSPSALHPELAAPAESGEVQTSSNHQRYATFTVELLLGPDDNVRRTRITHIQSESKGTWAGWEDARLVDFLVQHAGLHLSSDEAVPSVIAPDEPVALAPEQTARAQLPAAPTNIAGVLGLRDLAVMTADPASPRNFLPSNQPFGMRLMLDLSDVTVPDNQLPTYTATVYAKKLGGGTRQTLGEARGAISSADVCAVDITGMVLPEGLYRLEAIVILTVLSAGSEAHPGIMGLLEGGLFHVY